MTKTATAATVLIALLYLLAHRHTSRRVTALEHELADRQEREREKGRRLINTPRDEHRATLRVLPGGAADSAPHPRRAARDQRR